MLAVLSLSVTMLTPAIIPPFHKCSCDIMNVSSNIILSYQHLTIQPLVRADHSFSILTAPSAGVKEVSSTRGYSRTGSGAVTRVGSFSPHLERNCHVPVDQVGTCPNQTLLTGCVINARNSNL